MDDIKQIIVKTKLAVPKINDTVIDRKRVYTKLQQTPEYKLTLITAPAGYGKTTAAASWLTASGLPCAWLSLDESNNDPVLFWRYLMTALDNLSNLSNRSINRSSTIPDFGDAPINKEMVSSNILAGLLVNRLYSIAGWAALVLDDYHCIHDDAVKNSLLYFIKKLPAHISLVLLNRHEPDDRLDSMYARGQVLKINSRDLAFNADEVSDFFGRRGLHLTAEEASIILSHTEGWAAGLVAASLEMEEGRNSGTVAQRISVKNRHIGSFIDTEVFNQWPDEVKTFLIHTSFLDSFCASLCCAVTGLENSAEIINRLLTRNSFIVPLDQDDEWFKYHHLFAEFLQARLKQENPSLLPSLYSRAGIWLHDNGFLPEAIEVFIKAGEFDQVKLLADELFTAMTFNGEFSRMRRWYGSIPEKYYEKDIRLCCAYSWVLAMDDRMEAAEEWADRTEAYFEGIKDQLDKKDRDHLAVQVAFARGDIAFRHLDAEELIRCYSDAYRVKLEEPIEVGELNNGQPSMLKTVYGFYGRLRDIDKVYDFMAAQDLNAQVGPSSAYVTVSRAESLYERNCLKESYAALVRGLEAVLAFGAPGAVVPSFITLAKIKRAGGDLKGAIDLVIEGKNKLQSKNKKYWEYIFDLYMAELYLERHDVENAAEWLDLGHISIFDSLSAIREFEHLIMSRYLLLTGRSSDAVLLLNRLRAFAEKERRLGSEIQILCLLAVASYKNNERSDALQALDRALELGMEDGYVRTFIDEGQPMLELLSAYLQRGPGQEAGNRYDYAKKLLELAGENIIHRDDNNSRHALNTLTRKEYMVLQLISAARSNEEIARELGISVRTVKYHNANLYAKLGAKNRLEAVNRAREIGLLH